MRLASSTPLLNFLTLVQTRSTDEGGIIPTVERTIMPLTNHMSARVKAGIDTDLVQPDSDLDCTSKCPSFAKDRCTFCGFHKTSVESARTSSNSYTKADYCVPVFDEIRRLYGEDQARRKGLPSSKHQFVECVVVYKALNLRGDDTFDNKVTTLLSEGWQREGKFQIDTTGGVAFGVQMLTRVSYVVKVEEDTDCEHDFEPQAGTGKFVCSTCDCYGVRLSRDQRSQLGADTPPVICTAWYEEKFLPSWQLSARRYNAASLPTTKGHRP